MSLEQRRIRLRDEWKRLQTLEQASSILSIKPGSGDPPERFTLIFHGKGLLSTNASQTEVKLIETHRVELRLPYAYPDVPPDVRWLTPIFHPNVSFSGFIRLHDVGVLWEDPVSLDAICERLWDVARLAYMNLDNATNYQAKGWFETQKQWEVPVDRRVLRSGPVTPQQNIVSYRRQQDGRIELSTDPQREDVFYIGEDTPTPPPTPRRRPDDDEDIFYIGDE